MFRNYFKTAFRNLWKNRFYSSINIVGLAVGLATCMFILMYVLDELSFDHYNKHISRIYRVDNEVKFGNNYFNMAVTPAMLGTTMVKDFPQVKQYTRLRWYGGFQVKKGNENIQEGRVGYADSTFFEVFTIPVIAGDPKTALTEPHSLVITEKIAKKYFGTTDVVGQNLTINDTGSYKVTAVIRNIPAQSHFNFDFFVPMRENMENNNLSWLSENWNTYIILKENSDVKSLENQLDAFMEKYTGPELKSAINQDMEEFRKSGGFIHASLMPLADIHLYSNKIGEIDGNGNAQFVYIFSAVALLILLIACVNFMNLSTARSSNRAKEVGVRKVLGSLRKNLVVQFLAESFIISLVALVLALLITWVLLPYFNLLSGKEIHLASVFQTKMLVSFVLLISVVGLLAGSYPAFFLSSFRPIEVLKGKIAGGFKRSWLRNALVVFQFSISIALVFGTVVIYSQLNYIFKKDIGFNRDKAITISQTHRLGNQAVTFRDELLRITGVQNATLSGYLPLGYNRSNDAFFTSTALDQKSAISMQQWVVDENYIPTLGIHVLEGRNFSDQFPTDSSAIIINEAAAKFLATRDMLNRKLYNFRDLETKQLNEYHIIGIIKNFNYSSLRNVITPLALVLGKNNGNISVRIQSKDISGIISQIRSKWQSMAPGQPFDYTFMDDDFNRLFTTEQRTGKIFISFAVLAILIAGLGLFGLITYAAEQRVREIGIRKVLGASVGNITRLLSTEFLGLIFIASLIAFPLAWWAMNRWLQDFAYRTHISWWVFAFSGMLTLLVALMTLGYQTIRAALASPVKSLRTE